MFFACGTHGSAIGNVSADARPEHRDGGAVCHGGTTLMGRVEDVKDALPKRARNDKPVVIEEEAVALKHQVP